MTADTTLSSYEYDQLLAKKPISKDCFYILEVSLMVTDEFSQEEGFLPLQFEMDDGSLSKKFYASKIPKGKTWLECVKSDLVKDFDFPQDQRIWPEGWERYDTAKDKQGNELTRVLIKIAIEYEIDTEKVRPLGRKIHWKV